MADTNAKCKMIIDRITKIIYECKTKYFGTDSKPVVLPPKKLKFADIFDVETIGFLKHSLKQWRNLKERLSTQCQIELGKHEEIYIKQNSNISSNFAESWLSAMHNKGVVQNGSFFRFGSSSSSTSKKTKRDEACSPDGKNDSDKTNDFQLQSEILPAKTIFFEARSLNPTSNVRTKCIYVLNM